MRPILVPLSLACTLLAAPVAHADTFKLSSDTLKSGAFASAQVFNNFGCTGSNVSPQLKWSGAPAGTKSFAVTVYDPDAPTGSGWWHWVVINLPADTTELPLGAGSEPGKLPVSAVQIKTDYGTASYGGPCPPVGPKHHYHFTVYALKVDKLDVGPDASAALTGYMIHANSLGKATFMATYGR